MESLDGKGLYSTLIAVYPSLHPYAFKLLTALRGDKATGDNYNVEFANARIAEAQSRKDVEKGSNANDDGPTDFVTKFLQFHRDDPQRFTDYNILLGCLANVVAGSDTTAVTLSSVLYYLINSPSAMQKLRREIEHMVADGTLSDPVTFKEAQKMPYLQAVIKEGLRMHPATGMPLSRVVPKGGAKLAGRFVAEGVSSFTYLPLFLTRLQIAPGCSKTYC